MNGKSKDQLMEEARRLSKIVSDYWSEPSEEHIQQWLEQFDEELRLPLASELRHILSKSYFTAKDTESFLKDLISTPELVGKDPAAYWKKANFFNEQKGGESQHEFLELFDALLRSECGYRLGECGSNGGTVIYIDDILLSGNRLVNDLRDWIPNEAPKDCSVHAIFMGIHSGGAYYAKKALGEIAAAANKKVKVVIWRNLPFENFSNSGAEADVYRLRRLPDDEQTAQYIHEHVEGEPALLRPGKEANKSKFFSSEKNRDLLEQTFWSTGLYIRSIAPNLKGTHRPLGYTSANSVNKLGFGSIALTYRNCPNNCPLAYWLGDPWYPLFPRKTN